jgi:phosphatidylinositol-3,4,5-trisphosphate 5-phosphatase 2
VYNKHSFGILYFSIVFWLGDLNYRIDMDINDVKEHVSKGAFNKLLPKDQVSLFKGNNSPCLENIFL